MDENSVKDRISGWIDSNRQGEDKGLPCFWSLYAITSITTQIQKNAAVNCHNLHIDELEGSVNYLMDSMSNSTHVRYFAVRLRAKKSDTGSVNNFQNPYYQSSSKASINGIPTNKPTNDLTSVMIGLIKEQSEERLRAREDNNAVVQQLMMNQKDMEAKIAAIGFKAEIAKLKEENAALKNAPAQNPWSEIIEGIKPEVLELAKYHLSGKIPYQDNPMIEGTEGEQQGEAAADVDSNVLNKSLGILSKKVQNPEAWIFKLAFVLDSLDETQGKQMLNTLNYQYQQLKSKGGTDG